MTVKLLNLERGVLEIESDDGVGDSAKFTVQNGGGLYILLDEPWVGDTICGFGQSCEVTISRDDAIALRDFLNKEYP